MNPYRRDMLLSGMLEDSRRFIGLRDELEQLLARVTEDRPVAVSLVGPWGIGKSFLLAFLAAADGAQALFREAIGEHFRDDPRRLLFVTIDGGDDGAFATGGDLLDLLYNQILAVLANRLQVDDARVLPLDRLPHNRIASFDDLAERARWALTQAREERTNEELREQFEEHLALAPQGQLVGLLRLLDGWGLRVIGLFDNFDAIARRIDEPDTYDQLRDLASSMSMVLASRRALSQIVPTKAQSSPFFTLLEKLDLVSLQFLSPEEAERMIREPPTWADTSGDFRFSDYDVQAILEMTGLHPDLIRTSCEYLYRWTRSRPTGQDRLPPEDRDYLRMRLHMPFADFFAVLWRQLNNDERAILTQIAAGGTPAAGNLRNSAMQRLIDDGYVVAEGGRLRLFAGLFRDFVLEQNNMPVHPLQQTAAPEPTLPDLTDLEQRLIDLLKAETGPFVSREKIIGELYGAAPTEASSPQYMRRLDALVFRLRNKLTGQPLLIENLKGLGYRLVRTQA